MEIQEVTSAPVVPFQLGQVVAHRDDDRPLVVFEIEGEVHWCAAVYDCDGTPVRAVRREWLVAHELDADDEVFADSVRASYGLN